MPSESRSNDADGWIACDDDLHLIQMDKNLSHYGWVFRKVDGGLPYSVREATSHEMAHAQARQHLRIGVAQIAGQAPAPQPNPEPIAWMVGTAFWWTKEEAERDAAETGLPIVGVGPMTGAAPAEQIQGEPVLWRYRKPPGRSWFYTVHKRSAEIALRDGYIVEEFYTHADHGEVERLRLERRRMDQALSACANERDTLRALLVEALAFLDEAYKHDIGTQLKREIKAFYLSASAEPSGAVERQS